MKLHELSHSSSGVAQLEREIRLMRLFDHPNRRISLFREWIEIAFDSIVGRCFGQIEFLWLHIIRIGAI
jgi:hypothetical protein